MKDFKELEHIDKILYCARKQATEFSRIGEPNFWTDEEFEFKNENYEIILKISQALYEHLYLPFASKL